MPIPEQCEHFFVTIGTIKAFLSGEKPKQVCSNCNLTIVEIISQQRKEAYNQGVKNTAESIFRQLGDNKEHISVVFYGGKGQTDFNLKK